MILMKSLLTFCVAGVGLCAGASLLAGGTGAAASETTKKSVTFSKDVAPIFYKNCVACHRAGETAPMSLLTYKEARPWARSIREKVITREMPPWHADPHFGEFANDPRLTRAEIETITAWVDGGAKEGDPKSLPPAPTFPDGWKIGKPDLVVSMKEEHTVAADAVDQNVTYTAPTMLTEDRWVQAVEFRPGNSVVVHHAHAFVELPKPPVAEKKAAPTGGATVKPKPNYFRREGDQTFVRDDAPVIDDGCGKLGGGGLPGDSPDTDLKILVSYLPGKTPDVWPEGFAKKLPAGSVISFQLHYARGTGKIEKDRSSVGIVFAKRPPENPIKRVDIHNLLFKIPAGADNHRVTACYTFEEDLRIVSYLSHMHYRGKDMKFEAVYPDGRRETLLSVPNYDFNWQHAYKLKRPHRVPKGTQLIITAHFDNSAKNRLNPDPTKTIRWGTPSESEMMDGWIEYIPEQPTSDASAAAKNEAGAHDSTNGARP